MNFKSVYGLFRDLIKDCPIDTTIKSSSTCYMKQMPQKNEIIPETWVHLLMNDFFLFISPFNKLKIKI